MNMINIYCGQGVSMSHGMHQQSTHALSPTSIWWTIEHFEDRKCAKHSSVFSTHDFVPVTVESMEEDANS